MAFEARVPVDMATWTGEDAEKNVKRTVVCMADEGTDPLTFTLALFNRNFEYQCVALYVYLVFWH